MNEGRHCFQRLRDFVKLNNNPVVIKDESQDVESRSNCQFSSNGNSTVQNSKVLYVDAVTQTDHSEMGKLVESVVKSRMETLMRCSGDNKILDQKINAVMRRLFEEQVKLKKRTVELEKKLQTYENAAVAAKRQKLATTNSSEGNSTSQNNSTNDDVTQRLSMPLRTQPVTSATRRPPIQMVTPVPQIMRHPPPSYSQSPSFMNGGFNNQSQGNTNIPDQIITRVVNANDAPRMTYPQNIIPRMQIPNLIPGMQNPQNIHSHMHQAANIRNSMQMLQLLNNNSPMMQQNQIRWQVQQNSRNRIPLNVIPGNNPLQQQLLQNNTSSSTTYSDKHLQNNRDSPQVPILVDRLPNPSISLASLDTNKDATSHLPKLKASISASSTGIILTWDYEQPDTSDNYKVDCYQLYANQAKDAIVTPPSEPASWKKIGEVSALPLPMACTLTQIANGNVYHFVVVAVDAMGKEGKRSNPCTMRLSAS